MNSSPMKTIALAGNPNVGKSTLFNVLTGMKQHTGNWIGKTVTTAQGICQSDSYTYLMTDLPGTYSLYPHSAEEEAARDFLCYKKPDAVIVVCDGTCLERNLILVLQIMEITSNVIVCINFMDEVAKKQIQIDIPMLSDQLGVPVIGITAQKKGSISCLLSALDSLIDHSSPVNCSATSTESPISSLVLTAEQIFKKTVSFSHKNLNERDHRIDCLLTGKWTAYPLMLLLFAFIFWLTISGSNYPSQLISTALFWLQNQLSNFLILLHTPVWLHDLLILGIYRVLAWVISVMLPPMAIFFPLFTLLEDIGYLPRIAYNLDKPFQCCRSCGKQALTMCMG